MMEVGFDRALALFRSYIVGKRVRGQIVEDASLEIDCLSPRPDKEFRYFIFVHFKPNPPTDESPELNLIQRVFSEVPPSASLLCFDGDEAKCRLVGLKPNLESEWLLDDEHYASKEQA